MMIAKDDLDVDGRLCALKEDSAEQSSPHRRTADETRSIVRLLRVIATSSDAKTSRHDIIFNAAADQLEQLLRVAEVAAKAEVLDLATGIMDYEALDAVQNEARASLKLVKGWK